MCMLKSSEAAPVTRSSPSAGFSVEERQQQQLQTLGDDATYRLTVGHLLSAVPPLL